MAEVSVLSLKSLEILIKWKSGELPEHEEVVYGVFCSGGGETNGTDGFEESLQSLIVERLRKKVVNLDDLAKALEVFTLELNPRIVYASQLSMFRRLDPLIRQTISNVSSELLQLRERNPTMRLEEFKVYFDPVCWSSRKRLDFLCRLSDELSELPKRPQLSTQLDSKWRLHFKGNWITHIDGDFINKIDPDRRPRSRTFECLLRFVRNRWHHRGEFLEFRGTDNAEDFYNYFGKLFPDLLRVSYGVAYQFCREEPWFEKFCPVKHGHVDMHRTRSDTRSTFARHVWTRVSGRRWRAEATAREQRRTDGEPVTARDGQRKSGEEGGRVRRAARTWLSAALANQEKRKGCAASSKGE